MEDIYDDYMSIMEDLGYIEEKPLVDYDMCCGKRMTHIDELLICDECNKIINNKDNDDVGTYNGVQICKVGNRLIRCFGGYKGKDSKSDCVARLVNSFKSIISRNNTCLDNNILNEVCDTMYDITRVQIKKSTNRLSLFLALLHHVSIRNEKILTPKEVQKIIGKSNCKFSKGNKIIIQATLDGVMDRDKVSFGTDIYKQLIIKYLNLYNPKFYLGDKDSEDLHINTARNRKFCVDMIEVMLDKNIAFNAVIQTKCIAVVYYLIKNAYDIDDDKLQKKYFTRLVDVGENTFIKVYNTLLRSDVQKILVDSHRFS